jgi:hypothetical protein
MRLLKKQQNMPRNYPFVLQAQRVIRAVNIGKIKKGILYLSKKLLKVHVTGCGGFREIDFGHR